MRSTTSGSRNGSPVSRWVNTAIGTPQARWRDTHQSGLLSTIASIRLRACGGTQRTSAIAAKAFCRRSSFSMLMNHCGVLRKIVGAVSGGDMYEAGSLVRFDKAGGQEWDIKIVALAAQRMHRRRPGKSLAGKAVDHRIRLDSGIRRQRFYQGFCNEQGLARPRA